jgi:hypothetical protein
MLAEISKIHFFRAKFSSEFNKNIHRTVAQSCWARLAHTIDISSESFQTQTINQNKINLAMKILRIRSTEQYIVLVEVA